MNYARIVLSAVAATVAYFVCGFIVFGMLIAKEYAPFPGVYRPAEAVMKRFPLGIAGIFIAMLVLAIMYAKGYEGGSGAAEGARFGLLAGIFVACAFVGDNYVTLNISHQLAMEQAAGAAVEWTLAGIVIGLVYKPALPGGRQTG